ncbi:MAG: RNA polymerase factor sigma-54 [Desulfobacteraceae bacterium]|nr:RNA polymerase factor sigma-54 [Desulfobacteraceae bacterium]MCF8095280.1 RNA polymerase factor sigma-54 [Desulfobacteraceae bacterium]
MAIELQQNLKLQQQLVMTPQLQMAIKLLQLSRLELVETVRQELESNPTLEEADTVEAGEEAAEEVTENPESREVTVEESFENHLDWQQYLEEYSSVGRLHFESEEKESPNYEAFTASKTTLFDHLRWQLLMTRPTAEEENIGSLIIGNLNKYGYMDASVEEVAGMAGVNPSKVGNLLNIMQTFDPPGICARDLGECLLIQARQLGIDNPLVTAIIRDHLKDLENRRYQAIAKSMKTDMQTVSAAINLIRRLDPVPGERLGAEDEQIYITPDVYVYKQDGDYVVMLNDDDIPQLNINSYYRQAVKSGRTLHKDTRAYIRDRLRSAEWLIKSIRQRRRTIYNVMQSIVEFQRDFFDHGISHLKPMVLRDVAEDINMHESTISRVTTNKYAHTPHGLLELKFFFNSSINRVDGQTVASASVQEKIRSIIAEESSNKPFSDKKIAELLENSSGIRIARRTVAKYREMMGILPSSKRKQL